MFMQSWSLINKLNAIVWPGLFVSLVVVIVLDRPSPEPKTGLSEPAVPILTAVSPGVIPLEKAPVRPRRMTPMALAA